MSTSECTFPRFPLKFVKKKSKIFFFEMLNYVNRGMRGRKKRGGRFPNWRWRKTFFSFSSASASLRCTRKKKRKLHWRRLFSKTGKRLTRFPPKKIYVGEDELYFIPPNWKVSWEATPMSVLTFFSSSGSFLLPLQDWKHSNRDWTDFSRRRRKKRRRQYKLSTRKKREREIWATGEFSSLSQKTPNISKKSPIWPRTLSWRVWELRGRTDRKWQPSPFPGFREKKDPDRRFLLPVVFEENPLR